MLGDLGYVVWGGILLLMILNKSFLVKLLNL